MLLANQGFQPESVLVMRHRPRESELRRILPWLATDQPSLYNAYQQHQGASAESSLRRAKHLASFIGDKPGKAVFVGLYANGGNRPITAEEFSRIPANKTLRELGMKGYSTDDGRPSSLWFDLTLTHHLAQWQGRLIIDWPGPERSWCRWADRNIFAVHAITEESGLVPAMPDWRQIAVKWSELKLLPPGWKLALSQWRGVYYIFDQGTRKGYVGSASGQDNLLGRWLNYASKGDGGNKLLRSLNPNLFVFSILERSSPDMDPTEVVNLECTWKDRLHSRAPYGLNLN